MGIPHLITLLEPYSESQPLNGQSVVIDGPAFAYHVYFLCMGGKIGARGPFQVIPAYVEISEYTVQWLKALEQHGAVIKRIFFDGFLPPAKLEVRLSRLVGLTKRMSDYYYANQTVYLPSTKQQISEPLLFNPSAIQPRLTALPPTPFLVPAVLEALRSSSSYKNITTVVPGEADLYCSQYLSQYGGMVLTGDSDLLAHDLGDSGKVGFFKDISMTGPDPPILKCQSYWPFEISRRLSLPRSHGMLSLAFEMKMDKYASFQELSSRARQSLAVDAHTVLFDEFKQDYQTLVGDLPLGASNTALTVLRGLDPRISEYVLQYTSIALSAGCHIEATDSTSTHVFLPFLIDSPTRTSAWEMSLSVRTLSYALMNLVVPKDLRKTKVNEHKKQSDKSHGRELQLPDAEAIEDVSNVLISQIVLLRERFPGISDRDFWTVFAIYQDIDFANVNSKSASIKLIRQQLSNAKIGRTSSWDVIQLFAQIQASYYSFRMLKQISKFVIASLSDTPSTVSKLYQLLENLPNLCELQDLAQIASILQFVEESKVFEGICDVLGITYDSPEVADKKKAKMAKKKKKRELANLTPSRPISSNPFALLEEE